MNIAQRNILRGALVTVTAAMLLPPWGRYHPMGGLNDWLGFSFIFSAPQSQASIVVPVLLAEWIAIAIVSCILWALVRDPKTPSAIDRLTRAMLSNVDATTEAARINAEATIRAAEINVPRPAQMDLLDHHR